MSLGLYKDVFPIKEPGEKEAKYYIKKGDIVKCVLCPQGCEIKDGEEGKCLVRINRGGKLWAASYGKIAAIHLDPIEKKPLFHFYPTYKILSVGSVGCNFSCKFCQNWELVEGLANVSYVSPEDLASLAVKLKYKKNIGIAFTYNEPTIWFEYIIDTAKILKDIAPDMKVVMVTNGYISAKPLEELSDYVDAMNIDFKFAKEEYYKEISDAHFKPVLTTIKRAWELFKIKGKPFFELTYLVITGINDTEEDFEEITDFVAEISPEIPFHISRFFPHFLMSDRPPTPIPTLKKAYDIAKKKLKYVYVGNVWGDEGENTYCPNCNQILIRRYGFSSEIVGIKNGRCSKCGYEFFGILEEYNGNFLQKSKNI
jgi:pyruvate formate lyase activating enzyme